MITEHAVVARPAGAATGVTAGPGSAADADADAEPGGPAAPVRATPTPDTTAAVTGTAVAAPKAAVVTAGRAEVEAAGPPPGPTGALAGDPLAQEVSRASPASRAVPVRGRCSVVLMGCLLGRSIVDIRAG